jgi:hypothetical protein
MLLTTVETTIMTTTTENMTMHHDDHLPAQPLPAWTGWLRKPGQPWQQVCAGADYGDVWSDLLAVAGYRHDERAVLRFGENPGRRPARTRRRF